MISFGTDFSLKNINWLLVDLWGPPSVEIGAGGIRHGAVLHDCSPALCRDQEVVNAQRAKSRVHKETVSSHTTCLRNFEANPVEWLTRSRRTSTVQLGAGLRMSAQRIDAAVGKMLLQPLPRGGS